MGKKPKPRLVGLSEDEQQEFERLLRTKAGDPEANSAMKRIRELTRKWIAAMEKRLK